MIKPVIQILLLAGLLQSCKSKAEKTLPLQEAITESVYASGFVKSTLAKEYLEKLQAPVKGF